MKIFIDTNIFLNLLLKREGYENARLILNACSSGKFQCVVCDITLLNIDYIASKQTKNIRDFLKIVNDIFIVVGVDNSLFRKALKIDNDDLEDSVQYICAKMTGCSLIVTDDKSFYKDNIEVLDSSSFVLRYID